MSTKSWIGIAAAVVAIGAAVAYMGRTPATRNRQSPQGGGAQQHVPNGAGQNQVAPTPGKNLGSGNSPAGSQDSTAQQIAAAAQLTNAITAGLPSIASLFSPADAPGGEDDSFGTGLSDDWYT